MCNAGSISMEEDHLTDILPTVVVVEGGDADITRDSD